jgi:hypothetical protein
VPPGANLSVPRWLAGIAEDFLRQRLRLEKSLPMTGKSTWENLKIVNNSVRTLLILVFLGVFGYVGWLGYAKYVRPGFEAERMRREMEVLQARFEEQGKQLVKTRTALKLVKIDHRRATIKVVDKGLDEATQIPWFDVEFTELSPDGIPISQPRNFRLKGTMLWVDAWVVKFEDKYVEDADELRGGSLCVFKGLWGDLDERDERKLLDDAEADVETAYGPLNNRSDLEKKIWTDFWRIANDPGLQKEMGIRGNHGQVNYLQVEKGTVYEINLRASDGLTIKVARDNNT